MMKAVEGAVSLNDNVRDISVTLDGTWQKRGHSSMNGVIKATSLDTEKVIDFECLSKHCFTCKNKSKQMQEIISQMLRGTVIPNRCEPFPRTNMEEFSRHQDYLPLARRPSKNTILVPERLSFQCATCFEWTN
ncbi:hypothetical protein HNY73_001864 [Argiope bruennichi]|uniref:Mutator-like transposase domain-containing protein n=1 Tax=Argiope bruennichi TaxID=94029 RepID=A0A8T0FSS3_ARGBR|nr:hypothetical protein HNY73_001864 [Argiope bruennichi]